MVLSILKHLMSLMKNLPIGILFVWLLANGISAAPKNAVVPAMDYRPVPDFFQFPAGYTLGEAPGVSMDSKGHIYIFHRGQNPLLEFDTDGKFIKAWDVGDVARAHGLFIDSQDDIWLVDVGNHTVRKFDSQGELLLTLGTPGQPGEDACHFNQPTDVAIGLDGDIYVSDGYGNSRVVKFSKDGQFISTWGKKGKGEGEFNLPHAIVVDSKGRVYVADRSNKRIQVFTPDGGFIAEWKNVGTPYGFYMSPADEFYVTDGGGNRLLKMDIDGNILASMGSAGNGPGQFKLPHEVYVAPNGDIFISEITNHRVQKFVRND